MSGPSPRAQELAPSPHHRPYRGRVERVFAVLTASSILFDSRTDVRLSTGLFPRAGAKSMQNARMRALRERSHESCSAAILEGPEIIYVARIPARRIMSATLAVGSRLPAFHSSRGRIQLGFLDDAEIWRRLMSVRFEPLTPATITDLQALHERIRDDRRQGFSIVDGELERVLPPIPVPLAHPTA